MHDNAATIYQGSYRTPTLAHATVADAMHPGIVACAPETPLTDVARIMATHHVHCVAVMAEGHDDSGEAYLWGIVSDLDLIRAGIALDGQVTAGEAAAQPAITVRPDLSLQAAAAVMLERGISHLVVAAPDLLRPIGVLSSLDVAGILAWGEA